MVDIHTHILWEIDDGASSVEESIAMLEGARQAGTVEIVATPHWNPRYAYQAALTEDRIAQLTEKTGGTPRIHRGCEVHLTSDNVVDLLKAPATYTINGKQYLLVEVPHQQVGKHIEMVLKHLLDAGISPIVAHPERNPVLQQQLEKVESWVDLGCLMQLTALSLMGGFGASAKRTGIRMLDRGLAHVVASDAHDPVHRHARLDDAYQLTRARYGEDLAEVLFEDNPRAIVEGARLVGGRQTFEPSAVPWWRRWR
jgi:protein-tyrosine phosphatase